MFQPLNLILPPASLKEIVLAKIGLSLIKNAIELNMITFGEKDWLEYEIATKNEDVINDIGKLLLPRDSFKCFDFIIQEILFSFQSEYVDMQTIYCPTWEKPLTKRILKNFRFTSRGLVNLRESLDNVVIDSNLDISFRYRLACNYNMEDSIRKLWTEMKPEDFHDHDLMKIFIAEADYYVRFWSIIVMKMDNELLKMIKRDQGYIDDNDEDVPDYSVFGWAFRTALDNGEEAAASCYAQKIGEAEKMNILNNFQIGPVNLSGIDRPKRNILYMSFLNAEQLEATLEKHGVLIIFEYLKDWPLSDVFVRIFQAVYRFIDEETFFELLLIASELDEFPDARRTINFLWQEVPESFRQFALSKSDADHGIASVISQLYMYDNEAAYESMELLLRYFNKTHLETLLMGLVRRLEMCLEDSEEATIDSVNDDMRVLRVFGWRMISTKKDLNRLKKAASPRLVQEPEWKKFISKMRRNVECISKRKMDEDSVYTTIKKPCVQISDAEN